MEDMTNETQVEKKFPMLMIGGVIAVIAAVAIIFVSTQSKSATVANVQTTPIAMVKETTSVEGTSSDSAMTADSNVKEVTLEAGSFYYKPNQITVRKGQKVKVTIKSVDMMHDLVITELNVKSPITKSGETSVTEFTADKVGTFEFFCSVGQHRKMGQVGTIVVTE